MIEPKQDVWRHHKSGGIVSDIHWGMENSIPITNRINSPQLLVIIDDDDNTTRQLNCLLLYFICELAFYAKIMPSVGESMVISYLHKLICWMCNLLYWARSQEIKRLDFCSWAYVFSCEDTIEDGEVAMERIHEDWRVLFLQLWPCPSSFSARSKIRPFL